MQLSPDRLSKRSGRGGQLVEAAVAEDGCQSLFTRATEPCTDRFLAEQQLESEPGPFNGAPQDASESDRVAAGENRGVEALVLWPAVGLYSGFGQDGNPALNAPEGEHRQRVCVRHRHGLRSGWVDQRGPTWRGIKSPTKLSVRTTVAVQSTSVDAESARVALRRPGVST